jgi:Rod binding domain-containing protein
MDALSQTAQMAAQSAAPQSISLSKKATAEQAAKAGRQFESMFVSQMLKPMFDTLPTDGWFDGGQGEQMFRSMLVDNYAKSIAEHGNGIGLAKQITKTMLSAQEVHS